MLGARLTYALLCFVADTAVSGRTAYLAAMEPGTPVARLPASDGTLAVLAHSPAAVVGSGCGGDGPTTGPDLPRSCLPWWLTLVPKPHAMGSLEED